MIPRPPRTTRTDTLFPYTTLFRSDEAMEPEASTKILALDEAHSSLVRLLLSRPSWSRAELLDAASDLDLMLDGALERINEASFDVNDAPLIEGDDPLIINSDVMEKLEA